MSQEQPVDHFKSAAEMVDVDYEALEDPLPSLTFAQVHATLAVAQELKRLVAAVEYGKSSY